MAATTQTAAARKSINKGKVFAARLAATTYTSRGNQRRDEEMVSHHAMEAVRTVEGWDYDFTQTFVTNCTEGYVPTITNRVTADALKLMGLRAWNPKTSQNW